MRKNMNKIMYIILGFLIAFAILFIISCDDFLAPTIEIFNKVETPTDVQQDQKYEKKTEQKNESNNTIGKL